MTYISRCEHGKPLALCSICYPGQVDVNFDKPLTAYELADELQRLDARLHLINLFESADMLRQQADRIAELEKEVDKASEQSWYRFNKDGYAKPLSDEEIISMFEHPDDFNCIDFARAIEERHGIK